MPSQIRATLLNALVNEQGGLCAYTMKRIDTGTSHVEHMKPESLCRKDEKGSDLHFENLVSCFPRDGMPSSCRYGAHKKDDWWDKAQFISPLSISCEKKFHFNRKGEISAVDGCIAASKTIEVLALDHPTLTEDRYRAIDELINGKNGDNPLSKTKALNLIKTICNMSNGQFVEFCVAFRDALEDHVRYVVKSNRKRDFIRKQSK